MINSCKKRKILVCAPSNAAIDEIVTRICKDKMSTLTKEKVLRVGAMDYEPNSDVKENSLDYKMEKAIEKFQFDNGNNYPDQEINSASHGSHANSPKAAVSAQVSSPTSKKINNETCINGFSAAGMT